MKLSQVMAQHNLRFGSLEGDLDFCIVPQLQGIAVYFKGVRFVDENLHMQPGMNWKMPLRKGPWGHSPSEVQMALMRLIKNSEGKELYNALTEETFTFPENITVDIFEIS